MSMDFTEYRPEKQLKKEEENLPLLTDELEKFIKGTYPLFRHDSLKLNDGQIRRLAHLLIEFAEDLYLNIGMWKSYENHNINIFGTPLPCTLENGEKISENDPVNEYRIQHFLWNIYGMLEPNLIFSPHHKDLHYFTEEIAVFLNNKQSYFPKKSTIKDFLHQPEYDAYDIKRKLVWLGTKSYLFRENFWYYLNKENLKEEISTMDDFIVQVATLWSGLGVIDFNNFKKALEKQGQNLTDEDIDYMHALIEDNSLSPDFVRKIMAKYGNRSVMKAYHVDTEECLDFLMRKYKGAFYQERYPSLTVQ